VENLDNLFIHTVNNNVRQRRHDEFARSHFPALAADFRKKLQFFDAPEDPPDSLQRGVGVVVSNVVADGFEIANCGWLSSEWSPGPRKTALNSGNHVLMPDEFTAVGLLHALSDSGAEMGFFLNKAQSGIFYQPLRVGASVSSNAGDLLHLLDGEIHVHDFPILPNGSTDYLNQSASAPNRARSPINRTQPCGLPL
jgi:hypothetical protein